MSDRQETIMVVDDTPANLNLLERMLQAKGYLVLTFPRGAVALAAAVKSPPDLILLDINMPEMNGFEVCERLKADVVLQDIPVIFISALTATEDKVKAFAVGGVDYVCKPFKLEEVNARVETHLRLRRQQFELEEEHRQLQQAFDEIRTLRGIMPICSYCKKIRDDEGYWSQVEQYVSAHTEAEFSHGICPTCFGKELKA
jgi:DNA-binding response OmpR family regulator